MATKLFFYLMMLSIVACSPNEHRNNISITLNSDSIIIGNITRLTYITAKVFNEEFPDTITIYRPTSINALNIIHKSVNDKRQFALDVITNGMRIPIQITTSNNTDTTLYYAYTIKQHSPKSNSSIWGNCAKLINKENDPVNEKELRRWLYRQNKHLQDSIFTQFADIVNNLNITNEDHYITNDKIPIVKNITNLNYRINTDIKADRYILFATSSQKELDDFIEEVIVNNFSMTSSTVEQPLRCHIEPNSNGYKCIFLIALNNNWSKKVVPLGLIGVDNEAPRKTTTHIEPSLFNINMAREFHNSYDRKNILSFADSTIINLPIDHTPLGGLYDIAITDCDGNGLECNISFTIQFIGDVSKVVIHRTGDLAKWNSTRNFVFDLENENSPFQTNIKMHLSDGDNFIPITIYDKHGNYHKGKIKQTARFQRISSNDINIDNNINIDY